MNDRIELLKKFAAETPIDGIYVRHGFVSELVCYAYELYSAQLPTNSLELQNLLDEIDTHFSIEESKCYTGMATINIDAISPVYEWLYDHHSADIVEAVDQLNIEFNVVDFCHMDELIRNRDIAFSEQMDDMLKCPVCTQLLLEKIAAKLHN